MNKIFFLLIVLSFGLSETILIPEDYATIQQGIDASVDGDTILVADGDYVENLVLNKSIVLTSYAIYDNLDEWIIFDDLMFNQWVINNSHIENTRLIGSNPDNPDFGSVILITPDSEECISPEVVGFTIQGGRGTTVVRVDDEDNSYNVVLGGGILADISDPYIHHNAFENNGSEEVYSGGASQMTSSAEDWSFDNRFDNYNPRCDVQEFRLSNNLYDGNDAQYGNTMANKFHEDEFDMSGSIFDVFDCGNEESAVSSVWVKVEPAASVDYDDGVGQLCAFTAPNVYVDPTIPQECLDEGCGFQNNPFKTITRTLEMINPTESNPITIHLATGTYSPESGENFPINLMSNLNIKGEDEEATIIDAMGTNKVVYIDYCINNILSNLTIKGGYALWDFSGGITNLNLFNYSGGGIFLNHSSPYINNVIIKNNIASLGGGIFLNNSSPKISNIAIVDNSSSLGGGLLLFDFSFPKLINTTIANNSAYERGSGILVYSSATIFNIRNSIIWNNDIIIDHHGSDLLSYSINYSNIQGGWEGEGNIDSDPLFITIDYSLQDNSPCIDSGDPDLWYQDIDGTISDMGWKGGLLIEPNFIGYNFGDVSGFGSNIEFKLYNFRQTPIVISSFSFGTTSFAMDAPLPMTIASLESRSVNIAVNNNALGLVEDEMLIISDNLPDQLSVPLSVTGVEGNVLNGNLSGTYDVAEYRIAGDITVANGDEVFIQAGTKFLFSGYYNFNVYGTLKVIGTVSDSIVFDNYDYDSNNPLWGGFNIVNASDDTEFQYVRVSGIANIDGPIRINNSNPTIRNSTISNNQGIYGGGINLNNSDPVISQIQIENNSSGYGGAIHSNNSDPTIIDANIVNNSANFVGGGIHLLNSNPEFINLTITNNTASLGSGLAIDCNSSLNLVNSIIYNNSSSTPVVLNNFNFANQGCSLHEPNIIFSNIEGGWEGEGNMNNDPLFSNPNNGDYTLQEGSPCINAGTTDVNSDGIVDIIDYLGSAPDMGAYEFSEEDCLGELGGSAYEDDCGICVGGSTGLNPCSPSSWVFVANEGSFGSSNGSITMIDEIGNIYNTGAIGDLVQSIEVYQDKLIAIINNSHLIKIFNITSQGLEMPGIEVSTNGSSPREMVVKNDRVYFTNWNSQDIKVLNLLNYNIEASIQVNGLPEDIIFDDNQNLWITIYLNTDYSPGSKVVKIDISSNVITDIIEVGLGPLELVELNDDIYVSRVFYDNNWQAQFGATKIGSEVVINNYGDYIECGSSILSYDNYVWRSFNGGLVRMDSNLDLVENFIIGDFNQSNVYHVEIIDENFWFAITDYEDINKVYVLDSFGNILNEFDVGQLPGDFATWNINSEIPIILPGDTNFDGIVDILDIVRIVNQIMGSSEFNDDEFMAADYNSDGIVDILDIVQIINYILDI